MTRRAILTAAAICSTLALLAGCSMFEEEYTPDALAMPAETDIAYGPARGCNVQSPDTDDTCGGSQELDIYRSDEAGPNPVVLWVHGGGFIGGDKGVGVNEYFQAVLDDGWDIVAVNYRVSTPEANQWPVPLHDVKLAVRWVKANAAEQDWDAERVAAIGHSAGGNLVGMLATTANDPALEPVDMPTALAEVDSSIIAGVLLNSVSDVHLYSESPFGATVATYLGCAGPCPVEDVDAASVQTHVDGSSAPILAIHGAIDNIAVPEQGEKLRRAYEDAGIGDRFELTIVDDGPTKFQGHEPDVKRFVDDMVDFIDSAADEVA